MYHTTRYQELKLQASKNLPCPRCGKKVRRQTTFMQTLNPFNKNTDGQPKTSREIYGELSEQAAKWKAKPVMCTPCGAQNGGDRG